jgi:hypothetical protein
MLWYGIWKTFFLCLFFMTLWVFQKYCWKKITGELLHLRTHTQFLSSPSRMNRRMWTKKICGVRIYKSKRFTYNRFPVCFFDLFIFNAIRYIKLFFMLLLFASYAFQFVPWKPLWLRKKEGNEMSEMAHTSWMSKVIEKNFELKVMDFKCYIHSVRLNLTVKFEFENKI